MRANEATRQRFWADYYRPECFWEFKRIGKDSRVLLRYLNMHRCDRPACRRVVAFNVVFRSIDGVRPKAGMALCKACCLQAIQNIQSIPEERATEQHDLFKGNEESTDAS